MAQAEFQGCFSLVTGASSGLGVEFARQIAARSGNLLLAARRLDRLDALASELREQYGVEVRTYQIDLSESDAAAALLARIDADGLVVTHLINNAGVGNARAIVEQDPAVYARLIQLNCIALTELTTRLLPSLVKQGKGGVLSVASLVGFMPMPFMSVYSASKFYVRSFMMGLAVELKGTGVRSTALCPGRVPTGFEDAAGFPGHRGWVPGQLTAAQTVRVALRAYDRKQAVYISGFANRLLSWVLRLVPMMWMAKMNGSVVNQALVEARKA